MAERKKPKLNWEQHEVEIRRLYLAENWELKEIMTYINQTHGFHATKAQYESQLKRWDLRKNLTKEEWHFVHCRVQKRKFDGKESDVYFKGEVVPEKKVKKELSRRYTVTENQPWAIVSCPTTPQALSVSTPRPPTNYELTAYSEPLSELPWFRFQSLVEATDCPIHTRSPLDSFRDSFAFPQLFMLSPSSNHEFKQQLTGWPGLITEGDGQEHLSQLQSQMLVSSLDVYDGEIIEEIPRLSDPFNRRRFLVFIEFGQFYLANSLISKEQTHDFLSWIIRHKHYRLLGSWLEIKMPTVHASGTGILESTVPIEDVGFIQDLIDLGIDTRSLKEINRMYEYVYT